MKLCLNIKSNEDSLIIALTTLKTELQTQSNLLTNSNLMFKILRHPTIKLSNENL